MNNGYAIGDLSRSTLLAASNRNLRSALSMLSTEATTGQKSDVAKSVGGNVAPLAQLSAALSDLDGYGRNIAQSTLELAQVQSSLEKIQNVTGELGPSYLAEAGRGDWASLSGRAGQAQHQLETTLAALRTRAGDRFVFSGTATDTAPVGDATALMGLVRSAAVGATVADRAAAVATFFDAPAGGGGFIDQFYGGTAQSTSIPIADDRSATQPARADNPDLRAILKGIALAALAAEPGTTRNDGLALMQAAGNALVSAQGGLTWLRAGTGLQQQAVSDAATSNDAARAAMTLSRNAITSADPYETATALEETQTRLESLYALTARLSRLSLTEYLR